MDRFISIPREALVELLKASGSNLSPEEYLASIAASQFDPYKKYPSRVTASAWNKYFLLSAVVISGVWTCLPFGFGLESVLVTVILAGITYWEFRVFRGFRDRQPDAPILGFRNQSTFAAFIVVYCLYHAFTPSQALTDYREYMDPDTTQLFHTMSLITYLTVGVIGGLSQFWLAWYYRSARLKLPG